jgi:hypothetical protein
MEASCSSVKASTGSFLRAKLAPWRDRFPRRVSVISSAHRFVQ